MEMYEYKILKGFYQLWNMLCNKCVYQYYCEMEVLKERKKI